MSLESTVLPMLRPDGAKLDAKVEWEAVKYGECRVISIVMAKCLGVGELTILMHLRKPAYHLKPRAIAYSAMERV